VFRPIPPFFQRALTAYRMLEIVASPAVGGSIIEISCTGIGNAPIPDAQRAHWRSYQRRVAKRVDRITREVVDHVNNPEWRPPPQWYCQVCNRLRPAETRFCSQCGEARPSGAP
jgi:hypothetical protein